MSFFACVRSKAAVTPVSCFTLGRFTLCTGLVYKRLDAVIS